MNDLTAIAKAVIRGEYGNGEVRKINLEKDGHNYNDVQAEVNRLLSLPNIESESNDNKNTSNLEPLEITVDLKKHSCVILTVVP